MGKGIGSGIGASSTGIKSKGLCSISFRLTFGSADATLGLAGFDFDLALAFAYIAGEKEKKNRSSSQSKSLGLSFSPSDRLLLLEVPLPDLPLLPQLGHALFKVSLKVLGPHRPVGLSRFFPQPFPEDQHNSGLKNSGELSILLEVENYNTHGTCTITQQGRLQPRYALLI